jgi:hypothetical protein
MSDKPRLITRSQLTSSFINIESNEEIYEKDEIDKTIDIICIGKHKITHKSWTRKLSRNEILLRRHRT